MQCKEAVCQESRIQNSPTSTSQLALSLRAQLEMNELTTYDAVASKMFGKCEDTVLSYLILQANNEDECDKRDHDRPNCQNVDHGAVARIQLRVLCGYLVRQCVPWVQGEESRECC
jgi:hypothetical protein